MCLVMYELVRMAVFRIARQVAFVLKRLLELHGAVCGSDSDRTLYKHVNG